MKKELVERLIGKDVKDLSFWEEKFPQRSAGIVTRVAPSPTGFMHIGNMIAAVIPERFAHKNNGVFMLRIEDTDTKRKVDGAVDLVISSLNDFGIVPDEGPVSETKEVGNYGPYFQSQRTDIYKSGIKYLLENDLGYPCFCTEEELDQARKEQTALKMRPGYYGKWAKYRNAPEELIEKLLDEGKPYIFRFRAGGEWDKKRYFDDVTKGKVLMPENDIDIVIMKSDGLPTYHFAHAIDDHFMRTTHVIRGDEWLASLPLHIQLFEAFGWTPPKYAHIAPIQKLDDGNRRKLSKRKDPEANISYYFEQGYPVEAIKEYLINLANSNFEDFKKANPVNPIENFDFKLENLNNSGALLDFKKLDNISKEFIATLSSSELYDRLLIWAEQYDEKLAKKLKENKDYIKSILAIERDGVEKVRKDFYILSKINEEISFFFNDEFSFDKKDFPVSEEFVKEILNAYIPTYNHSANKEEWFENVKETAAKSGYAKNAKEKDKDPEAYKGTVSDVATILRVLITGRTQSPDLYAIMQILGKDETLKRLKAGL
ncbi:MAG: glutamate--tRNA ligase [Lactobacillaceae bacterium]|jgi:glutamyl-tRNA synthetase|nr:glutamate--tRNA ligase [Lactobacillaceae bacterium]